MLSNTYLYKILQLQFFGEFGHTFMEFVTNSGDYCQAQHFPREE